MEEILEIEKVVLGKKIERLQFQLERLNDYVGSVGKIIGLIECEISALRVRKAQIDRENLQARGA